MLGCHVCEKDPRCDFSSCPAYCCLLEVAFAKLREAQKPEHGFGDAREYSKPATERSRFNLEVRFVSYLVLRQEQEGHTL